MTKKKAKPERIAPNAVREGDTVVVTNPVCMMCGNGSSSRVDWLKYYLWVGGGLIDQIFKEMNAGERELMITGTHPYCWSQMMNGEDEDENDN